LPWLCAGDFNEILHQHEQLGGNPRNPNQIDAFSECLTTCGLTDLGYSGYDYTWSNKREGAENIQCRLDRGMATVEHLITEESDHLALLIKVQAELVIRSPPSARGFMFEEMWTKHEGYEDMVKSAWDANDEGTVGIHALWKRLRGVSRDMKKWSFEEFGSVRSEIKRLKVLPREAKEASRLSGHSNSVKEIEHKLHDLFDKEEIMYRQ
jgi:hypothetical protein